MDDAKIEIEYKGGIEKTILPEELTLVHAHLGDLLIKVLMQED